jgi:hypothetical protein
MHLPPPLTSSHYALCLRRCGLEDGVLYYNLDSSVLVFFAINKIMRKDKTKNQNSNSNESCIRLSPKNIGIADKYLNVTL